MGVLILIVTPRLLKLSSTKEILTVFWSVIIFVLSYTSDSHLYALSER